MAKVYIYLFQSSSIFWISRVVTKFPGLVILCSRVLRYTSSTWSYTSCHGGLVALFLPFLEYPPLELLIRPTHSDHGDNPQSYMSCRINLTELDHHCRICGQILTWPVNYVWITLLETVRWVFCDSTSQLDTFCGISGLRTKKCISRKLYINVELPIKIPSEVIESWNSCLAVGRCEDSRGMRALRGPAVQGYAQHGHATQKAR